ncbi:MAG: M2 family metallopeptidase [Pseudomonadota bacterium]
MADRAQGRHDRRAEALLDDLVREVAPLERAARAAQWEAMTRGGDARYREYGDHMVAYRQALSHAGRLAAVRDLLGGSVSLTPTLRRRLQVWEMLLAAHRADPNDVRERVALETRIEQGFSAHRATLDGAERTMNDLTDLLRSGKDRTLRRAAWEAQKSVGDTVAEPMQQLMKLRNRLARGAGYRDWWDMQIRVSELDPAAVMALFDDLARITDAPFREAKARMDEAVAGDLGVDIDELAPWDYSDPFFQEVPVQALPAIDASTIADPVAGARVGLEALGFRPGPVLDRSSLYEAPGKNPHAFTSDLDRSGDVRVLANIRPTLQWHVTLLHELGHATYTQGIAPDLPWELRREAHSLTTEGIALLFESLADDAGYLEEHGGLGPSDASALAAARKEARRLNLLVFSRWCQVMVRFEAAAYRDPDGDLETLWWDLVERYQGLHRPVGRRSPDWASKIHVAVAPVYYQNYLLGQAFAAQLRAALAAAAGPGRPWHAAPELATRLWLDLFASGARLPWPEAVAQATGAPLGVDALLSEML